MTKRFVGALLVGLCLLVSCNRDPEAAKRRYIESGNKYFDNGKYKEALIMYRNALKRDLEFGEAYYRSALAELELQRWANAFRSLHRAVELQPENLDAHSRLANLYLNVYLTEGKKPKQALTELTNLTGLITKRFPDTYEEARLKGYLEIFEQDLPGALEQFEKANKLKPYQPELVLVYMQTLVASKQVEQAEKLGYQMLERDPSALRIYDALVLIYASQKRLADVERVLNAKVDKNPKAEGARLQLAAHLFASKRRDEMMAVLNGITSSPGEFPEGRKAVGDFFLRIGELDLAAENYRKGAEQTPKDKADYQKRLVEVLVKQNRQEEAARLVNEILEADPKDNEAIALRASLSLLTGDKDKLQAAINDLQTVISRMPQNFVLRYNLGRALLAKQNWQAARVQFEEAVKLRPDYIPPRISLAQMLLQTREWGKAVQMADEILDVDKNNVVARLVRSRALIGMGDTRQARTVLAGTTEQFPDLAEARLQMAALDLQEKNFRGAEDNFRRLYQQRNDPRAFLGLVETYVGQGQHVTAMKMLREELASHPDRTDYRVTLGNVALGAGDHKTAIAEYRTAIDKVPDNAHIWLRLSEAYRRSGDITQAIATTKKAQEIAPADAPTNLQLALLYESNGQRDQAKPVYEQVLKVQPDNVVALNNLAYLLAETGADLDQALTMAQRARQAVPNSVDVADTLGWIYIKKNLPDSAIPIFKELTAKQPTRSTFHYHLGMALFQKGDKPSARRALEAALQHKPTRDEETSIRELISRIG